MWIPPFLFRKRSVDNLFTGKKENLNPAATFYKVDIRSQEIETIIEKERPEVINHHAAQISVPASVKCPFSFYFTRVKKSGQKNYLSALCPRLYRGRQVCMIERSSARGGEK